MQDTWFKKILPEGVLLLISNVSWMMVSEVIARASRFVTLFVLAAYFTNIQYGTVMLALVCHELLRVLTRLGVGARIIQCQDGDLSGIVNNAVTLQWLVNLTIAVLQILLANTIADYYQNLDLVFLLQVMAVSHLVYPIVTVKVFMLQRNNQLRYFGIASGACIAFENLLVALLVYIYKDIAMVAYTKIAAAVFWVLLFYRSGDQKIRAKFNLTVMKALLEYSGKVLGSELLKAFRWQADSLFAARILTPEMFGLYSFAKSASIGIGQTLSSAFLSGIYPYLCHQARVQQWCQALRMATLACGILALAFLIQALLAPWYIKFLFGDRWLEATLTASLLCLLTIPTLISDFISSVMRVHKAVGLDLLYTAICSGLLASGFVVIQPCDVQTIVWLMLSVSLVWVLVGLLLMNYLRQKSVTAVVTE